MISTAKCGLDYVILLYVPGASNIFCLSLDLSETTFVTFTIMESFVGGYLVCVFCQVQFDEI